MKINVYILSLLLIFTISSFNVFSQNCQEDDYIALRALYLQM